MEHQQVQIEQIDERYRGLRLPDPEAEAAVRRSIERHGMQQPLVLNRSAEARLVLVDGFKRLLALRALKRPTAMARLLVVSEEAAQAAILHCNAPTRGLSELEEGWVVRSLVRERKLAQKEVAALLGRHKSWVSRRLMLVERLAAPVQDDVRLGLLTPTAAREVAQLPRGNQAAAVESIRRHGLSARQTAELVMRQLCCEDGAAVKALLEDPLRYLSAETKREVESKRDPRLSEYAERVRRSLVALDTGAVRAGHALRRYRPADLHPGDLGPLAQLAAPIDERLRDTQERLAALLVAARGEDDA